MSLYQPADCSVFSTYVEVILKAKKIADEQASFLHVCGGDPTEY